MDNMCYDNWIVRYISHHPDGSYTQFHKKDFRTKEKALAYIEEKNKSKHPNEEYVLIDNNF